MGPQAPGIQQGLLVIEGSLKHQLVEAAGQPCLELYLPENVDNKTLELSFNNHEDAHCDVYLDNLADGSKIVHLRVPGYCVNPAMQPKYKKQSRRYILWLSKVAGQVHSPTAGTPPVSMVDDIDGDAGDTFHDAESGSDLAQDLAGDTAQQGQVLTDVSTMGGSDVIKKKGKNKSGGQEDAADADDRQATVDQDTCPAQPQAQHEYHDAEAAVEQGEPKVLTRGQKKAKRKKAKKARAAGGQASGEDDSGSDAEQGTAAKDTAAASTPVPISGAAVTAVTEGQSKKAKKRAKKAAANSQAVSSEDASADVDEATLAAAQPAASATKQEQQGASAAVSPSGVKDPFSAVQTASDSGAGNEKQLPGSLSVPMSRLQSATLSTMTSGVSLMTPASGVSRRVTVNMDQDFNSEPDSSYELSKPNAPKLAYDELHGPYLRTGFCKSEVKGEDKWLDLSGNKFEVPALGAQTSFAAFAVFDGHGGKQSATEASKHLLEKVCKAVTKVKSDLPSPVALPGCTEKDAAVWAVQDAMIQRLPKALHAGFVEQDQELQRRYKSSGTTATLAVLVGWELLVANVGDSTAFLDTGAEVIQISGNHRVTENDEEQARVKAAGSDIAQSDVDGVIAGPLRVWPGGLAMTRSLGDKEAGPAVTGEPEIRQITIPANGARLIIASDGLWDAIQPKTIIHKVRHMVAGAACNTAMHTALEKKGLSDDITVIVVDFCVDPTDKLPPQMAATAAIAHRRNAQALDLSHVWKPLEAPSVSWIERLNSRRDAALQRLRAKLQAEAEAKAKEAAARQAAAEAAMGAQSDTYRELLDLKFDEDALDAAMKLGASAAAEVSVTQPAASTAAAAVEEQGDAWTTVEERSRSKASQAGQQGRGHRGEGRGGRGAARGGRGGRGPAAQLPEATHSNERVEAHQSNVHEETAHREAYGGRGRGMGRGRRGRGTGRGYAGEAVLEHDAGHASKEHVDGAQHPPVQQEGAAVKTAPHDGAPKDAGMASGPVHRDSMAGRGRGSGAHGGQLYGPAGTGTEYGGRGHEHGGRGHEHGGRGHEQGVRGHEQGGRGYEHGGRGYEHDGRGYEQGGRGYEHRRGGRGGRGGRSFSQQHPADAAPADAGHTEPTAAAPVKEAPDTGLVPPPPATDFGYSRGRGGRGARGGGSSTRRQSVDIATKLHALSLTIPELGPGAAMAEREYAKWAAGQRAQKELARAERTEDRRNSHRSAPDEQQNSAQRAPVQAEHQQQEQQHSVPKRTAAVERSSVARQNSSNADGAGHSNQHAGAATAAAVHEQPHSNGHAVGRGRGGSGRGRGRGAPEPAKAAAPAAGAGIAFGDFGAGYGH